MADSDQSGGRDKVVSAEGEQLIKGMTVPGSTWQQVPRGPAALSPTLKVLGALQLLS